MIIIYFSIFPFYYIFKFRGVGGAKAPSAPSLTRSLLSHCRRLILSHPFFILEALVSRGASSFTALGLGHTENKASMKSLYDLHPMQFMHKDTSTVKCKQLGYFTGSLLFNKTVILAGPIRFKLQFHGRKL